MTHSLRIFILFISMQGVISAQNKNIEQNLSYHKKNRAVMESQIRELKSGVLLVRLHKREKAINALKEIGRNQESEILNEKQTSFNRKIVEAFRTNFTFCPVYFFYNTSSDSILNEHVHEIVFLNSGLQPDTTIKLHESHYLTAEFSDIEQDTAEYFSENYLYHGENGLERRSSYYGGPSTGLKGLRIMSKSLVQLKRPFPYYVRSFREFPKAKKVNKTVSKMN